MHIPDGLLPAPVLLGGYALTGLGTWYSLKQINRRPDPSADMPKAALLTAAFFVASSIHIPIPPVSVHLVLNGLLGVILGYYAFPAILIGLLLQAVMFGHGGLTALGVNTAMMGGAALLAYALFQCQYPCQGILGEARARSLFAFLAGAVGLGVAALVFAVLMVTTLPADINSEVEQMAIYGLTLAHLPLMALEGTFTVLLVGFLQRIKPEVLKLGQ